jgi:hypothetical protein
MTILIRGKFLGARNREFTNSQGSYSFYEIGVENSRPDGWAAHSQFRQSFRYQKSSLILRFLIGLPHYRERSWRSRSGLMPMSEKNGAAIKYFLESDQIVEIK